MWSGSLSPKSGITNLITAKMIAPNTNKPRIIGIMFLNGDDVGGFVNVLPGGGDDVGGTGVPVGGLGGVGGVGLGD